MSANNPLVASYDELYPEDIQSVSEMVEDLLLIIEKDRPKLKEADDYLRGIQADPYMPDDAGPEYRLLAQRCKTNYMPLVVTSVAQQMYVDSFRAGDADEEHETASWRHWQRSGLDARQHPLYRSVLTFGHAFTITEMEGDHARTRTLSPRKTAALYEDTANDLIPTAALTVVRPERTVNHPDGTSQTIPGTALMWTSTNKYAIKFKGCEALSGGIQDLGAHGSTSCPVTRFTCDVDLDGRTTGLVRPLIPLQDRINQSVFDLLIVQSGGAFKVRTISGMVPPIRQKPIWQTDENGNVVYDEDGQPVLDHMVEVINPVTGQPEAQPIQANAKRLMFAADPETKFGQLDETPLDGYISSIDMSIRHLSSVTQMPPDYLLGQIANLSAEALSAAERALSRKVAEFQAQFGESWERVFRIAAELEGDTAAAEDEAAEVIWRDLDKTSISRVADALGKMRTNLSVPAQGLWKMIPGVTQGQLEEWSNLLEESDPERQFSDAINRAIPTQTQLEAQYPESLVQQNSFGSNQEDVSNDDSSGPPARDSRD